MLLLYTERQGSPKQNTADGVHSVALLSMVSCSRVVHMRKFHRVLGILLIFFFIFPILAGCKGALEKEGVGEKVKPQKPDKKYYKLGPRDEHGNRAWVPRELESIILWKKKKGKVLMSEDKYFDELRQACEEVFFSVDELIKRPFNYSIYYIRAGFEVVVLEYKERFYVERPGVDWFKDVLDEDKKPFFVLNEDSPDILHLSTGGFVIHKDLTQVRELVKKVWEEDP